MCEKTWVYRYTGRLKDISNRSLFRALRTYTQGDVLDVGGWDFFLTARKIKDLSFKTWTTLEIDESRVLRVDDSRHRGVVGDGCKMDLPDAQFDTYVSVGVLEHVYHPIAMVEEAARVLRPGGHGIFLVTQTTLPHMMPYHFYNFTRYWIERVMPESGFTIIELTPVGGLWQNVISHFFYFAMYTVRAPDHNEPKSTRSLLFWPLVPFMAAYSLISLPFMLIFGLADLTEGARTYIVTVQKNTTNQ